MMAGGVAHPDARIIDVRGLTVAYETDDGEAFAVNDVDLSISPGEIVGLVGVSGAGKSSLALALMNLVAAPGRITAGEILFRGHDLRSMSDEEQRRIRGAEISLIVQSPRSALNPMLTIGRQIENVLSSHTAMRRKERRARAVEMLRSVGINDPERRVNAYPHELSGGMAQRALIAMSLACSPQLLIADEPTSGLDVTIQAQILDELYRGVRANGTAALIVTQDFGVVANYCDRVIVMYAGRIVESVRTTDFFSQPGHPSAEALLSSQSGVGSVRLVGPAFDYTAQMDGCPVAPRCPWVKSPECTELLPELVEVAPGHDMRCVRYHEIRDEIAAAITARSRQP